MASHAAAAPRARLSWTQIQVLTVALGGSMLVSLSGQFVSFNIADIQGEVGASADEGSWLVTAYSIGLFGGLVFSPPMLATLGLRRYMAGSALLFSLSALASAVAPSVPAMIGLRALQGLAAGGFGPMAFAATFIVMAGPRLPFGLAVLALILLLPPSFGPVASGLIEHELGWQALYLVQAGAGAAIASAAILIMPRAPIATAALDRDWTSVILLALALGATVLVLGQGTRLYWLDSPLIAWTLALAAGTWAGFVVSLWRSSKPALNVALLARRSFAGPISLNLLFRAGFASTAFLIPQFLMSLQGYRPLELGRLFLWTGVPQLLAFPLTWWLLQRLDGRLISASGLLLFGLGVLLAADGTSIDAGNQFRASLALAGAGQVLFLVPNLVAGGGLLTPADGPTASLLFNATTVGGTILGVALATELVTERQKFHLLSLAESAAAYGAKIDQIEMLAAGFATRIADDTATAALALASVSDMLRREALVLSFNDGFLAAGALLVMSAAGLLLFDRQPPLGDLHPHTGASS